MYSTYTQNKQIPVPKITIHTLPKVMVHVLPRVKDTPLRAHTLTPELCGSCYIQNDYKIKTGSGIHSFCLKYWNTYRELIQQDNTDFQMEDRSSGYRPRLSSIASTTMFRHSLVLTRQQLNISWSDSRMSKFESCMRTSQHKVETNQSNNKT